MNRLRMSLVVGAALVAVGLMSTVSSAAPPPCPSSRALTTLPQLEAFVVAAGGETGPALTDFFEHVDENGNGLICFKVLPDATPYPTPPIQGMDDR